MPSHWYTQASLIVGLFTCLEVDLDMGFTLGW